MAYQTNTFEQINPFSFLGLLAGEGQVPGSESQSTDKVILSVALEETARELASDATARDTFFTLMETSGQMAKVEAPKTRRSLKDIRIVRPVSLGGELQGAFAH